ncbi:lysophospholipase [Tenuifilaceae bacterium CYCD]|nr:lysophospholipase [Tenuifilaceae bacterium CYCD]
MEAVKQWWTTSRGNKLFAWHMLPVSQPKAIVLLVHGHGEHSWRYMHWAKQFSYNGYAFFSWDHFGHGMSDGQPGHIRHYEQLLLEVDLAITKIKEQFPSLPIILYGHSMGGNIAINYAIRRDSNVKLLVATSPWIELTTPAPKYIEILSRIMYSVLPFYPFKSPIKPEQISHVEEEVRKYATDPLIHSRITPRLYTSIVDAGLYALKNANRIKIPVLLMHGADDSITLPDATRRLACRIPNATYVEWPSLYHEVHNEAVRNEVFIQIKDWIEKYLK